MADGPVPTTSNCPASIKSDVRRVTLRRQPFQGSIGTPEIQHAAVRPAPRSTARASWPSRSLGVGPVQSKLWLLVAKILQPYAPILREFLFTGCKYAREHFKRSRHRSVVREMPLQAALFL